MLDKDAAEKLKREEEQNALDAEMERRRKRVEEWRLKKLQEEQVCIEAQGWVGISIVCYGCRCMRSITSCGVVHGEAGYLARGTCAAGFSLATLAPDFRHLNCLAVCVCHQSLLL